MVKWESKQVSEVTFAKRIEVATGISQNWDFDNC